MFLAREEGSSGTNTADAVPADQVDRGVDLSAGCNGFLPSQPRCKLRQRRGSVQARCTAGAPRVLPAPRPGARGTTTARYHRRAAAGQPCTRWVLGAPLRCRATLGAVTRRLLLTCMAFHRCVTRGEEYMGGQLWGQFMHYM